MIRNSWIFGIGRTYACEANLLIIRPSIRPEREGDLVEPDGVKEKKAGKWSLHRGKKKHIRSTYLQTQCRKVCHSQFLTIFLCSPYLMGDHATLKEDSSKKIARVIFILSKVQSE